MRYQGLVYRAHNPYWSFDALSGEGAERHGGRFNPKGVPALYTSLSEPVALAEYRQGFAHRPQPTTLCAYQVDCEDLADLTDPRQCAELGVGNSDLTGAWELLAAEGEEPPTWRLARALIEQGRSGVLVPSYAVNAPPDGRNLVFWHWGAAPPWQVLLIDDARALPRNQNSWR